MTKPFLFLSLLVLMLSACSSSPVEMTAAPPSPTETTPQTTPNADVVFVEAVQQTNGTWTFSVTVAHPDTGWDDYANGWDVVLPDGKVLKPDPQADFTRVLAHPHVDEQPFTRSQSGLEIPHDISSVTVRAHDIVHGFGGQQITVRLDQPSGLGFTVQRIGETTPSYRPAAGYPTPADGNHYYPGKLDLQSGQELSIALNGQPVWIAGTADSEGSITIIAAHTDGKLDLVTISNGQFEVNSLSTVLPVGMPPAIDPELGILNFQADNLAPYTFPVLTGDKLAQITSEGGLQIAQNGSFLMIPVDALPDARLLSDGAGQLLLLTGPTLRYDHSVLGDALEASSVTLLSDQGEVISSFSVPPHLVIEGLFPLWVDLNLDGVREIIVTLSDADRGARLAVYSPSGDLLAESAPIGTGYRWRHLLAAAPFGPQGQVELVDVLTPHLGGIVTFYQLLGEILEPVASLPGYTSHVIGTRNLDMALAADLDADGQAELLIPTQDRTALGLLQRSQDGVLVLAEIPLDSAVASNLIGIPLPGDALAVAVGLENGQLRIWLP